MGYRTIAVSKSSSKRELCLSLGADHFIDASSQDGVTGLLQLGGADVVLSTVPDGTAALRMLDGLAYGGKLLAISLPMVTVPFTPRSYLLCRRFHGEADAGTGM